MLSIGHQGAAGHAPGNSIEGIDSAIALGADGVELDVQVTADGELILFHDKLLDRLTNGSGFVRDYTFDQLRRDVRLANNEPIPILSEGLEVVVQSGKLLVMELIVPSAAGPVVEALNRELEADRFLVSSFHHNCLRNIKECFGGKVRTMALMEAAPVEIAPLIEPCRCDVVGLGFESVSERTLAQLAEMSIPTYLWTVNDRREIAQAAALGAAGIITDFPERAR